MLQDTGCRGINVNTQNKSQTLRFSTVRLGSETWNCYFPGNWKPVTWAIGNWQKIMDKASQRRSGRSHKARLKALR